MYFRDLVQRFVRDLEAGGASVVVTPFKNKPARITVVSGGRTTSCLIFLWEITPGGGKSASRPRHERRIQVTTAERFPLAVGQRTIIGGWNEESGAWGFWDVMRHTAFSVKSPSFQISSHTLDRGFHDGVATQDKKNTREIVLAVSPAFLLWYVEHGEALHQAGHEATEFGRLLDADPETEREFLDAGADDEQGERRYRLIETVRAVRDARFRPNVLRAYSHQCALCPVSLNLVDAAHIVPVSRPKSTDDVTNGLALCRLHHAAYDGGLVGVRSDYSVVLNPKVLLSLDALGFLRGLDEFKGLLRTTLRVPAETEVRPKPDFLRLGMVERNWPVDEVG